MESRQKRLQALSQQSKRLKHESAILPVDKSKNESSCKVEVTPIISYKNAKKTPLSGPIVNCFRKQKEKQERKVSCPICTNIISYDDINNHLDNDCKRLTTEQGKGLPPVWKHSGSDPQNVFAVNSIPFIQTKSENLYKFQTKCSINIPT